MRSLRPVLGLAVLAAVFAVAPAGAANSVTYQDSTGEDPAAPDITTVVVANDDKGALSFRVNIPNRPQLTRDILAVLFVDSDANPATGDPDTLGADYVVQLFLGEVGLFKWDGTDFTRRPGDPAATTLNYSWNGGVTIRISAAELGNSKRLNFAVVVVAGLVIDDVTGNVDDTNATRDVAPASGSGFWRYDVKIAPARVVFKSLKTAPASPKAGGKFTVSMAATRSDTGETIKNGRVSCTAKAGTRTIRPSSARFVGGQAVCVFSVPRGSAGKTLRGTIKITFEGKSLTRTFSAKIR